MSSTSLIKVRWWVRRKRDWGWMLNMDKRKRGMCLNTSKLRSNLNSKRDSRS